MRNILLIIGSLLVPALVIAAENVKIRALIVPEQEAVLSSQMDGRIIGLPVEVGDRFKKGQILIEFDCEIFNAELEKAKMDLEAATETNDAQLRLQEFGSASELDVAVTSAKKKRAQADVLLKQARVKMCIIKSPFDGRVVNWKANPHENVTNEDPILEILDDTRLKLHILTPSHWLKWLKTGLEFPVHIDETGKKYRAKVTGLGARVNPVNQTLEVEAAFIKRPSDLLAGMSGTAVFVVP